LPPNYQGVHKYEDIDYEIPPNLPLPKGGNTPLFGKEGMGRFFNNEALLMHSLVSKNSIIGKKAYTMDKGSLSGLRN